MFVLYNTYSYPQPACRKWYHVLHCLYMTKQQIKNEWEAFRNLHGRIPTAQEIGRALSRKIQRNYGGIQKLRKELGFSIINYSSGKERSAMAHFCNERSMNDENLLLNKLQEKFGQRPHVIPWESYTDRESRNASDCGVYHKYGHFFVDVFFAKDTISLTGCINHKMKKLEGYNNTDPIYLICSNPEISQDIIDTMISAKKNPLPEQVQVVTMENFLKILENYKAMEVLTF